MAFGYIIVALFMLSVSFYLIFRLNRLNSDSTSILMTDIPSMKNGEKLLVILLEQVKNEKKYLITNDSAFLDLFHDKKGEFLSCLKSIEETITRQEEKTFANQIKNFYDIYLAMSSKNFILANYNNITSTDPNHEKEKKKTIDQLTGSINALIHEQEIALIRKIELFQMTVHKSTKISLAVIMIAILFGAIFSYFFIRSICTPVKTLKEATERIAHGDLDCQIKITSCDEIGTLGMAFNQMCSRLKELDQMKSDFISNVSHNLKTPLTAIREANELMLDKVAGQISESQFKLLNIIKESTLRLIMMINDLLDISRLEAGLMRYNFQYSSIQEIISRSIEGIRFLAENKKINVMYENGVVVPEILLDRNKIAQVMENILSNAVKFTPLGGAITVKTQEVKAPNISQDCTKQNQMNNVNSFVQVSISDTGIGIPDEYHDRIFEKFGQVDDKGKGGIKGTGLGLFIAKKIIIDHGGNVWVENNPGYGSTFHFILPSCYSITL